VQTRPLLDPTVVLQVRDLSFVARSVVDGFVAGQHKSRHRGTSVDFAEHRPYSAGDDIRRIDWRLFARTDRYFVKQFEADSNATFLIALDISRSMRFGTIGITKLDYARGLAACLAYLASSQKDRVGLMTFDSEVREFIPPRGGRLDAILQALDGLPEALGDAGPLAPPLGQAAEASRRSGVVVLLSDLYEEPEAAVEAIRALQYRGSEVVVLHILDPAERAFPFDDVATFQDLETGDLVPADPEKIRSEYRVLIEAHIKSLRENLGRDRVQHVLMETSTPLEVALRHFLRDRGGNARP
jgi:uncharacterized protein (DUF58 family)